MKMNRILSSLVPSLVFVFLAFPLLGIDMSPKDLKLTISLAPSNSLTFILVAGIAIFLFQYFRFSLMNTAEFVKTTVLSSSVKNIELDKLLANYWVWAAFLVILFTWPLLLGSSTSLDISIKVLIYVMLGLGLNVVVGLAGLLDLGYVGFYAVGAYCYAMLNFYFDIGFWVALPVSVAAAATAGFLLGFPVLRLRGDYLAIVTLGFGEIIRILLNNLSSITGGPNGINGIDKPTIFGLEITKRLKIDKEHGQTIYDYFGFDYDRMYMMMVIYFLALIMVLFCLFVINRLQRMPIGRAWEALREDEIACRSLGINRTAVKLSAFTIGASTAGFAGAFFASYQGSISPESFIFFESAIILAIVVLGGMGSQLGVILAAIVLTALPEMAREFNDYRMLVFGALMVLMMIWRPQGFIQMKRPSIDLNGESKA